MKYLYNETIENIMIIFEDGEIEEGLLFLNEMAAGFKSTGENKIADDLKRIVYEIRIRRQQLAHA